MKKALVIAGMFFAAALMVLASACWKIDSEKEGVVIIEEPIFGDPAAAEGVTLKIASCFGEEMNGGNMWTDDTELTHRHLLWNTAYAVGGNTEAESVLTFSSHEEGIWRGMDYMGGSPFMEEDYVEVGLQNNFGTAYSGNAGKVAGSSDAIDPDIFALSKIIRAAAERTSLGEERTELIRVGDYYEYYPIVDFSLHSSQSAFRSAKTSYYDDYYVFLTEFFRISTGEDMAEVRVRKDADGNISYVHVYDRSGIRIIGTAAYGEKGCYYTYYCEDKDGISMDRGQNNGIFYFPLQEEEGRKFVDLDQIKKVCDLPAGAVPVKLLLDEAGERLFLLARGEREFSLAVHTLENEIPVLSQQIPVLEGSEGESGRIVFPDWRRMTIEDGGIMMIWTDHRFSFAAEADGEFRLWYSGIFPADGKEDAFLSQETAAGRGLLNFLTPEWKGTGSDGQSVPEENTCFTKEAACFFDGKRLVLASQTGWQDTDVLLSVYEQDGLAYCGLYRYGGVNDAYTWLAEDLVKLQRSWSRKSSIALEGKPVFENP